MTPQQWEQVKSVFEAARGSSDGDRLALVARLCGDDGMVRAEVQSLLATDRDAGRFLEPPGGPVPGGSTAPLDGLIGRQIGGYTVTGVLGRGGMGTVYEAQQAEPRRRVALKVMRGDGPVDRKALRLFQRETLALARLNHPNIAAIYDAGHTDDARHFFAQELVEGESLADYAARRELSIDEKLELFLRVCDGIAYAHQRGVIHRDLKPSNILVAGVGAVSDRDGLVKDRISRSETAPTATPKILDFGLARITDADMSLTTLNVEAGKLQGTLAYMSPEQTQGRPEDIDQRSDIYSLGVVLYELLTGQMPYEVRGVPLPMAVRAIRVELPQRPSSIHRVLRGDLETILLKALEKEPGRRYQNATALAEDLQRFQRNEPILARPPSVWYQFRKLATRHKLASAGLGLVFLLAVGFAITLTVLYQRALGAETAAVSREQSARELSDFLLNLVDRLDARSGEKVGLTEFWRTAGIWEWPETVRTLVLGRYNDALAMLNRSGGKLHLPEAQQLCNTGWLLIATGQNYRAQNVFLRAVHAMSRTPERFGSNLSSALTGCQMTFLVKAYFEDAANASGRAYEVLRAALAPGDDDLRFAAMRHGSDLLHCGRITEAAALLQESLPLAESAGTESAEAAKIWSLWGAAQAVQGRYDEAEPYLRRAAAVHALEDRFTPEVANVKLWLCACLLRRDAESEAELLLSELAAAARQQGCDAIVRNTHSIGVLALREIVRVLVERGEAERALELFGTHLPLLANFLDFDGRDTKIALPGLDEMLKRKQLNLLGGTQRPANPLGVVNELRETAKRLRWSDPSGALQLLEQAAQLAASDPAPIEDRVAAPWHWKAEVMFDVQRFPEAEELRRRAYEICLQANGPDDFDTAHAAREYGRTLLLVGKFAKAEALLLEALPLETIAGLDGFYTSYCYEALGAALLLQGRPAEAEPHLRAARERCARWLREESDRLATIDKWLCACLYRQGRLNEAEVLLEQLKARRNHMDVPHLAINGPLHVLALREIMRHFVAAGEPARAVELIGDNAALAGTFSRLNETVGGFKVSGLQKRMTQAQEADLAQLDSPGEHVKLAQHVRVRGQAFQRFGDYARALEAFEAAAPHLSGPDEYGCQRCGAQWSVAGALRWLNRFEESAALMAEVYQGYRQQQFGQTRADTVAAGREYATELLFVGKAPEAEQILREILPHELELIGPESAYAALALERLGAALALQGRFREAEPLFRRARDQHLTIWAEDSGQLECSTLWLTACLFRTGDRAAAEELVQRLERQAAARGSKSIARPNPNSVIALRALLQYLVEKGEHERASSLLGTDPKVLLILEQLNQRLGDIGLDLAGPDATQSVNARSGVGRALLESGKPAAGDRTEIPPSRPSAIHEAGTLPSPSAPG